MKFYCIPEVKNEIEKLLKKNSYKSLQSELYCFFDGVSNGEKSYQGFKLNCSSPNPFYKKRIEGRGGYRIYYYIIEVKNSLFLTALHPKVGKYGKSNLSKEEIKIAQKRFKECFEKEEYFKIKLDHQKKEINFNNNKEQDS